MTQMIYGNGCGRRKNWKRQLALRVWGSGERLSEQQVGTSLREEEEVTPLPGGPLGLSGGRSCQVNQGAAGDRQAGGRQGGWRN